jgi:hypothetical protein
METKPLQAASNPLSSKPCLSDQVVVTWKNAGCDIIVIGQKNCQLIAKTCIS